MDNPRGDKLTEKYIERIKLFNFKRFLSLDIPISKGTNVFIGDNESGKSTILLAVELALGGNSNRVESLGIDSLISIEAIKKFYSLSKEERVFLNLPVCKVEIFLNEQNEFNLNGANNSENITCDGMRLEIAPRHDLKGEIDKILNEDESAFPFEFYQTIFKTFQGGSYTGYSRHMKYLLIDNTQISNEYAMRSYIKNVYDSHSSADERNNHKFQYRQVKSDFSNTHLSDINTKLPNNHLFELKNGARSTLENDLTISEQGIQIDNMGKGRQCFVRTEFALAKGSSETGSDVTLLEEPENHLSHGSMNALIYQIQQANESQLLVTTHNSLVSARLDLRNAILLSSSNSDPMFLNDLNVDTAKFFSKAPITNILEFALSKKVILVEGAAEFILMAAFLKNLTGVEAAQSDIHIISVGGLSFKRYLEVAFLLNIKTVVITDNDHDFKTNITEKYADFDDVECVEVFADTEKDDNTFEVSMYRANTEICNALFKGRVRTNTVQPYMLANKSEVAYQLLENSADDLVAPEYIAKAVKWINA